MLLRLPDELEMRIEEFKKKTGISKTNFVYNAVVWYMATKGLISLSYISCMREGDKKK